MEVYLNIVEWGPGVFGAEAASQYHFHKSAWALDRHEAALLAAALPNPRVRNPGQPGPGLPASRARSSGAWGSWRRARSASSGKIEAGTAPIRLWPARANATIRAATKVAPCGRQAQGSIMAVPKRKTSRMKRGNRRSHHALATPTYVEDKELGELRRPHHIDPNPAVIAAAR